MSDDQIIQVGGFPSEEAYGAITISMSNNFAEEWFNDALNEARSGNNVGSKRKEILFAVCCAESYIYEWARKVLNYDIEKLKEYFPIGKYLDYLTDEEKKVLQKKLAARDEEALKLKAKEKEQNRRAYRALDHKWQEVPKELNDDKFITGVFKFEEGHPFWDDFLTLKELRDGLVHAHSSRPYTSNESENNVLLANVPALDKIVPGWATNIIVELITELHKAVGDTIPNWLVAP